MAVLTQVSPTVLAELDEQMLATLAEAQRERWTTVEELLATIAELLHGLYVVTVQANSKKAYRPTPLTIPRPGRPRKQETAVSPGELFRHLAGG